MPPLAKTASTAKPTLVGENGERFAPGGDVAAVKIKPTTLVRSSAIFLLGIVAGRGLNFFLQIVLSNLLGLKAFGTYTYCNLILSFLSTVCQGGFAQTTVRYLAVAKANRRQAEIRGVIRLAVVVMGALTIIVGSSLYLFRQHIAARWLDKPEIAPFLIGLAVVLPGMVLMSWIAFALRGFRDISAESIYRNLLPPLILLLIVVAMASFTPLNIHLALAALFASIFTTMLIGIWRLRRHLQAVEPNQRPGWRRSEVLKSALSNWLTRFSDIAMNQADRLMIGALNTLSQVGIYHAVFRIADFQTVAMGSFVPMFSTVIAEAHAVDDRAGIVRYYRMVVRWALLVTMPICVACCLFAAPILRLFGPEFVSGAPVLIIVALASLIDAGVGPAGQFLQMMGRERVEMICLTTAAVLAIGLNAILIPKYGAMGAAMSAAVSVVLLNLARLLSLRKILGVFPYTGLNVRLIAVAAVAAVLTWLASPAGIWVQGLMLVSSYTSGALWLCLDKDDRATLAQIRNKLSLS